MAGEVINIHDYMFPWREVMTLDKESSRMQVYVNDRTGEAEIVQTNDEGEAIRTPMCPVDAALLAAALSSKKVKKA